MFLHDRHHNLAAVVHSGSTEQESLTRAARAAGRNEVCELDWEKELNIIRGKNLVGKATKEDVSRVFEYIELLEVKLDEADCEDTFGTQGWRYYFGIADD